MVRYESYFLFLIYCQGKMNKFEWNGWFELAYEQTTE